MYLKKTQSHLCKSTMAGRAGKGEKHGNIERVLLQNCKRRPLDRRTGKAWAGNTPLGTAGCWRPVYASLW